MDSDYADFLARKAQSGAESGFKPHWLPGEFFDFQTALTTWAAGDLFGLRNGQDADAVSVGREYSA